MDETKAAILRIVQMVPSGSVMSYGQIATYIGKPKEAREVGWAMRDLGKSHDIAWWRILNNAGEITISGNPDADAKMQKSLLEKEGIAINEAYKLDIDTYRFRLDETALRSFGLEQAYIKETIKKYEEPRQTSLFDL
jgi:methylated-DNA-protein-cysteine methyltransferase-like protein